MSPCSLFNVRSLASETTFVRFWGTASKWMLTVCKRVFCVLFLSSSSKYIQYYFVLLKENQHKIHGLQPSSHLFSAVLDYFPCFTFSILIIRQVLLLPFALPIRSGKDKPYSYGACNLRIADCGCYAARCDGNTCRIVKCLNKITAVRCASQILSAPLASGTTKHRKIHGLQSISHLFSAVPVVFSYLFLPTAM